MHGDMTWYMNRHLTERGVLEVTASVKLAECMTSPLNDDCWIVFYLHIIGRSS